MAKYKPVVCRADDLDVCVVCRGSSTTVCYKKMEGVDYCPIHGGPSAKQAEKIKTANHYRLTVWKNRLNEFTQSDSIKSLREEIGILRIVLEETVNKCSNQTELLMYSAKISDLAVKIEKLVMSCDRLERNMGEMMDRPTALKFAADVVDIIGRHVVDVDTLDNISHEIVEILRRS